MELSRRRRRVTVSTAASFLLFVGALMASLLSGLSNGNSISLEMSNNLVSSASATHRKLLLHEKTVVLEPERSSGERCVKGDILIHQGPTAPLPSGIPTFTVEITNMCFTGCNISQIHLKCGWFSSAHPINPKIFKRIAFDDCLVNDGKPLVNGAVVNFIYATSFKFPLSVSSVFC